MIPAMRWRTSLLTVVMAATASGCAFGDINPGGPDTRFGLTTTQVVGTWTVSQGSGSVTFEQGGTFTATGIPATAFEGLLPDSSGTVNGTGTWTLGPNHVQDDQLPDLVDLEFRTIDDSESGGPDVPLDAQCDGTNVFLAFGNIGLLKDGLTCTLHR
jgi:hypothetical protein